MFSELFGLFLSKNRLVMHFRDGGVYLKPPSICLTLTPLGCRQAIHLSFTGTRVPVGVQVIGVQNKARNTLSATSNGACSQNKGYKGHVQHDYVHYDNNNVNNNNNNNNKYQGVNEFHMLARVGYFRVLVL